MERVLQSLEFGPHRVDVLEQPDDEGGGTAMVLIDGAIVTDPPLDHVPDLDEVMHVYARWQFEQEATRR